MRIDQTARALARSAKPLIEDYLRLKRRLLGGKISAEEARSLSIELAPRFVDLILDDEVYDVDMREQLFTEVRLLVL